MRKLKINFTKLLKGYKKGWVGISQDFTSIVVSGKTLKEARKKASRKRGKIYYFPTGESYSNYIGLSAA